MADLCGKDHVDRLPIIVTSSCVCQLLKVSKITGVAGKNRATAVVHALEEWSLQERVVGMCFDTTNSNTPTLMLVLKLRDGLEKICCIWHVTTM